METKICIKCGIEKSINKFEFRKERNKYRNQCNKCRYHNKGYFEKTRIKIINWKIVCIECNKYKPINCFEFRKERNTYRRKCIECRNRDKKKNYISPNNEIREKRRKYEKDRMQNDIIFRLKKREHCRIKNYLKNTCNYRNNCGTLELIGCNSFYELKEKLSKTFYMNPKTKEKMSWDLFLRGDGKIHIDHIRPCSSFDFTKDDEIKKCFNINNQQLLWAEHNLYKSDKIMTEKEIEDLKKIII